MLPTVVLALALHGVDGPFPSLNAGLGVPRAVALSASRTILIGADGPVSIFEHTDAGLLLSARRTDATDAKGASDIALHAVDGLVVGADGVVYVSTNGSLLHRRTGRGWERTLAPSAGEVAPVRPSGLAMDARGRILIADPGGHRVFRLDHRTSRLEPIAGTGVAGFSGDGGPAIAARLDGPEAAAIGRDGRIYIADRGNQRIRRLSGDGKISTVVGGLTDPTGLAWIRPASLLVAESAGHRIRRVDVARRTIHAFAGTGVPGFSGDGAAAAAARLRAPRALVVLANGDVVIADSGNRRIRKVSRGLITTIAGDGGVGYVGDGGPASAESDRIGARLSSNPTDPHAHEEAALTFVAFALRERAGDLGDVRHSLNRATAHLALAGALRGATGESATGRIARIAVEVLAGRQVPALAALEKQESAPGPEGAWARSLKLRITEDWREVGAQGGTLLERLHGYAAFKKSFDGPRALEYIRATGAEPIPDWGWIALESSTVSVEAGNTFGPALLHATLAELASVLLRPPQDLTADGIASAVDAVPGPAVRSSGQIRTIKILDPATWGQFYGRHLLQAAQTGDNYFRKVIGMPERSNAFWVEVEKYLGRMELFPALHFSREQALGRRKPAAGMPSESALRSYCAPFVRRVSQAPETVVSGMWMVFFHACDKERTSQSIPMTPRWFAAPALPGTAQAATSRINNVGVNQADPLTGLKALAPFDDGVVGAWRRRRGSETPADVAAAYGPKVEYSLPVLRRAARATEDPAAKRPWLEKACAIAADECLDLGGALVSLGADAAAVQAYERGFREARDRVNVSNQIAWLARYYLDHGRAADAENVARDAAGVYSQYGLALGAEVLEKLGRLDEAEGLFRAIGERYKAPNNDVANDLKYFYVRAARRPGGERFAARSRQAISEIFPRGLERVTIGELSGPPSDGAVITTETRDSARLGVHKDDIMVALDGFRVHNAIQYRAVRAMSDDPKITVIVWDGRQYKEVQGSFADRRFGSLFGDYKPPAAKP